jgi:voltage-gated potassium channel
MPNSSAEAPKSLNKLRATLRLLYHGHTPSAVRFQISVLVVDLAIIAFFVASPLLRDKPGFLAIDYTIALILALDLLARALATSDLGKWVRQLNVLVDIFILLTLLAPAWFINFGFLRILRLWTMSRSNFLWDWLGRRGFARYEDVSRAVVNLLTFLFVVTGFIYTVFAGHNTGLNSYIEALYFTVATVTTTGFGDITLPGDLGKLTAIVVMIIGISLFVRLAQAVFRPDKVTFPCPQCGLQRHDYDAVHCKACGHILNIPNEGD